MSLKFAPTTRVRNLYAYVDPETGEQMVERNEYNANATGNVDMPGYTMHSRQFRPHSKSTIQRAHTVMRGLHQQQQNQLAGHEAWRANGTVFNTGLGPSQSANSYPGYVSYKVNIAERARNMQTMKAVYGDNWVEATVEIDSILAEEEIATNQILAELEQRKSAMEIEFTGKTGLKSPTELTRIYNDTLRRLASSMPFGQEYLVAKDLAKSKYIDDYDKIKPEDAAAYNTKYNALRAEMRSRTSAYEAIRNARIAQIRVGRPIGVINRRTLKNRLNAARNVAEAEAPTVPEVAPSKSCFGNCGYE